MDLYGELAWRGLVYDATDGARDALAAGKVTAYIGFDPTAASLHVGSLLPILTLARLRAFGHCAIALVGGGTGLIGDPSGKAGERQLLGEQQVRANVAAVKKQLIRILRSARHEARDSSRGPKGRLLRVDNARWLKRLTAISFMRDVGKHFTVNWMQSKESVKRRLESQEGISYTEFSYLLLQAFDYLQLFDRYRCTVQMGGSDQWGNIMAGIELIRRVRSSKAHGIVHPLVTTASGAKFGKTEAGTVWLDASLTGSDDFYQFWLNIDDRDAVKYLKLFTFLSKERIGKIEAASSLEPEKRIAQRELARQVTRLVHGDEALRTAEANASIMFARFVGPKQLWAVPAQDRVRLPRAWFERGGLPVLKVLMLAKLTSSSGEGARLIKQGGIKLNDEKITDARFVFTAYIPAVADGIFKISKGKTRPVVVELTDDPSPSLDKA